ncbi:tRNA (N(6)-L-threonylcarbamoyladenosine(37)-C(2))-methylthiotransferase [Methanocella sp. MCL-LM]|uniref:tRNA (N(6)-L-threonylcarbamoyladenosine(37)-C(2))- methylthiotransferase n=1 Tax=Methanocella sp. MCL-LM TaxID=3412035 RepID=UPI003C768389
MRVYIETYGCTANEADSAGIRDAVLASGGAIVAAPEEADAIVINTCAVTGHTANSMTRAIARFPGKRVIVAGCMAVAEPERLSGYEVVDSAGPLPVVRALGLRPGAGLPVAMSGRTATIKIAEGCNGQCSYCIVRLVRGRLRSVPAAKILEAVRRAIDAGASEIFLTAQDSGAYGLDTGVRLPALIRSIASMPGDFKVRIGMMNPFSVADILPDMIDVLNLPKVYKFAHIPVQSGSDRILKLMQRPYTEREYSDIVASLRAGVPGITFSTDYIVGFPTETDEDFCLTLEDLRTNRPLKVNITRFSPRPGTPAASLPDLLERTKKERSRLLTALHHEVTSSYMQDAVGSRRTVLVSEKGKPGTVISRDASYNMVVIQEDLPPGMRANVEISAAKTTYMIGRRL